MVIGDKVGYASKGIKQELGRVPCVLVACAATSGKQNFDGLCLLGHWWLVDVISPVLPAADRHNFDLNLRL